MKPFANEEIINQIRGFFNANFTVSNEPSQLSKNLRIKLENLMTSGQLFTNNVVAILDQSNFSYRYISPSIKKIFGVEAKVFMKGGMGVALSMISPEDNAALLSLYKKSHSASDEFTN